MNVSDCASLAVLDSLPNVQYLNAGKCKKLLEIKGVPDSSIRTMRLEGCDKLRSIITTSGIQMFGTR